ncbi:unnamed protein product, partial [Ectocarpus sp. 8 AP-2014]
MNDREEDAMDGIGTAGKPASGVRISSSFILGLFTDDLIKPHGSTPGSLRNRTGRVGSGLIWVRSHRV